MVSYLRFGYCEADLTAAYLIFVQMEKILRLSNHSDTKVLFRHYVDSLTLPATVGRSFFDGFMKSNSSAFSRHLLAIISASPSMFQLRLYI